MGCRIREYRKNRKEDEIWRKLQKDRLKTAGLFVLVIQNRSILVRLTQKLEIHPQCNEERKTTRNKKIEAVRKDA